MAGEGARSKGDEGDRKMLDDCGGGGGRGQWGRGGFLLVMVNALLVYNDRTMGDWRMVFALAIKFAIKLYIFKTDFLNIDIKRKQTFVTRFHFEQ